MASVEHLELAQFIKAIHQDLRNNSKRLGAEKAWQEHCANKSTLKKYSKAMQELSTKYWKNNIGNTPQSRVQWVRDFCDTYFFGGEMLRQRARDLEIANKINLRIEDEWPAVNDNKIKMLDVGSCCNLFQAFDCFDVLAIDIAPATKDVCYCDFINVKITECTDVVQKEAEIFELPSHSFDVVAFCLLLEYLPCPDQRLLCCIRAYKLLKFEGLLIIITPDSKHVGANVKYVKSWRYILASLGFSRIKYDKLLHIHCMAFRKSLRMEVAERWTKLQHNQDFFTKMYIPQDFNKAQSNDDQISVDNPTDSDKLLLLRELPYNFH